MLRYALTIFLSAFLLFQVQPLISKFILPWFGGTPAVWTTAMLFFQVMLLAGYAYAHLVATKLQERTQAIVHMVVLAVAIATLPIIPGDGWKPASGGNPTWQILLLLGVCVGVPYFVLATTSPLMQAWFSRTHPGRSPYRLYALSNVGSLLALLSFPFVFEPWLSLRTQGWAWSIAFALVALLAAYCAIRARTTGESGVPVSEIGNRKSEIGNDDAPGWGRYLMWLILPACGSTMFLAVTNQMCLDVAVVPFFWVLPLSLYLLSFIVCFDNERWYFRPVFWAWLAGGVLLMLWLMHKGVDADADVAGLLKAAGLGSLLAKGGAPAVAWTQIIGYSLGLFGCCMVCHGELVRLKPSPRHLTAFYLMVSAGGALGGIFVSLLATRLFKTYLEFHIGLFATCALAMLAFWMDKKPHLHWPVRRLAVLGITLFVLLGAAILIFAPFPWLKLQPHTGAKGVEGWALIFSPAPWVSVGGDRLPVEPLLSAWVLVGILIAGIMVFVDIERLRRWGWLGAAACLLLLGVLIYYIPSKLSAEDLDAIDVAKIGLWVTCALAVAAWWIARKPHHEWKGLLPILTLVFAIEYLLLGAVMVLCAPFPYPELKVGGHPVSARALLSIWAVLGLAAAGAWAFLDRLLPRLLWLGAGAAYLLTFVLCLDPIKAISKDSLAGEIALWVVCALGIAAVWLDKWRPAESPARYLIAGAVGLPVFLCGPLLWLKLLPKPDEPITFWAPVALWPWWLLFLAALWVLIELRGTWRGWWFLAAACFLLLNAVLSAELFGAETWLKRPSLAVGVEHLVGAWLACGLVGLAFWRREWAWALCLPLFLGALLYVGVDLYRQASDTLSVGADLVEDEEEREGEPLHPSRMLSRNFYGVLKVAEYGSGDHRYRYLSHGRINHGAQLCSPEGRRRAITYFGESSGIGKAILHHPRKPDGLRVAILGLGTGTLAAYGQKGDFYRFYEINPNVIALSGRKGVDCPKPVFTYLTDCKAEGADVDVVLGDGRLSLERHPEPQQYDVLAMDAFSSDAVPVHLLTAEAFDIYRRHIKPDGIIAVNVTNRFVDLRPVVRAQAERLRKKDEKDWRAVLITSSGDGSRDLYYCAWMLVTANKDFLAQPEVANHVTEERAKSEAEEGAEPKPILWTDDYSNLFRILK